MNYGVIIVFCDFFLTGSNHFYFNNDGIKFKVLLLIILIFRLNLRNLKVKMNPNAINKSVGHLKKFKNRSISVCSVETVGIENRTFNKFHSWPLATL